MLDAVMNNPDCSYEHSDQCPTAIVVSGGVDPRDFGGATRFYGDVDFSAADG
jgi:hypothetical protein